MRHSALTGHSAVVGVYSEHEGRHANTRTYRLVEELIYQEIADILEAWERTPESRLI